MKSNHSTNSVDGCGNDSREIPLNGFNRFDPKYVSIGPKALRESSQLNLNKCATLRHNGRYGGSLIERGVNPVLKKASPPSVTAVSKEAETARTLKNEMNNNVSKPINVGRSSFVDIGSDMVSDYETDNGTHFAYKRTPQRLQNLKYDDTKNNNHAAPSTVYSIDASSYQQSIKKPQHVVSSSNNQYQFTERVESFSTIQLKPSISNKGVLPNISIVRQPLPEIPQSSQSHRNQQPLSASNLGDFRTKRPTKEETNDKCSKLSHNSRSNTSQPKQKHESSTKILTSSAQRFDQPPMLPPKIRNKDQTNRYNVKQNHKHHHTQSNSRTLHSSQKITEQVNEFKCSKNHHRTVGPGTFAPEYEYFSRGSRSASSGFETNRGIYPKSQYKPHSIPRQIPPYQEDFLRMCEYQTNEGNKHRNSNKDADHPYRKELNDSQTVRSSISNSRNIDSHSFDLQGI